MSALTTQFDADVAAVETELPVTFTFNGKDYVGSKTQTVDSLEMEDAGFVQKYDFELEVRVLAFGSVTPPAKNGEIKIAPTSYRVEKVTPSQDGVMFTFHMVERN